MIINNRELSIVQYSTERNWLDEIPNRNWLCILVDNNKPRRYIDEVVVKILVNDVCYVCTVGQSSEKNHDLIDEEISFRQVDIDKLYLPKHHIMTTWDCDLKEGIWFAFYAAHHDEVKINKVIILDMTDGNEIPRINQILKEIQNDE